MIKVTEVKLYKLNEPSRVLAFASCIINDSYFIGSIAMLRRKTGGIKFVYPTKKGGEEGKEYSCFNPITKEAAKVIEDEILKEYEYQEGMGIEENYNR